MTTFCLPGDVVARGRGFTAELCVNPFWYQAGLWYVMTQGKLQRYFRVLIFFFFFPEPASTPAYPPPHTCTHTHKHTHTARSCSLTEQRPCLSGSESWNTPCVTSTVVVEVGLVGLLIFHPRKWQGLVTRHIAQIPRWPWTWTLGELGLSFFFFFLHNRRGQKGQHCGSPALSSFFVCFFFFCNLIPQGLATDWICERIWRNWKMYWDTGACACPKHTSHTPLQHQRPVLQHISFLLLLMHFTRPLPCSCDFTVQE